MLLCVPSRVDCPGASLCDVPAFILGGALGLFAPRVCRAVLLVVVLRPGFITGRGVDGGFDGALGSAYAFPRVGVQDLHSGRLLGPNVSHLGQVFRLESRSPLGRAHFRVLLRDHAICFKGRAFVVILVFRSAFLFGTRRRDRFGVFHRDFYNFSYSHVDVNVRRVSLFIIYGKDRCQGGALVGRKYRRVHVRLFRVASGAMIRLSRQAFIQPRRVRVHSNRSRHVCAWNLGTNSGVLVSRSPMGRYGRLRRIGVHGPTATRRLALSARLYDRLHDKASTPVGRRFVSFCLQRVVRRVTGYFLFFRGLSSRLCRH